MSQLVPAIYVAICTIPNWGAVAMRPLWDACGCPTLHPTATEDPGTKNEPVQLLFWAQEYFQ